MTFDEKCDQAYARETSKARELLVRPCHRLEGLTHMGVRDRLESITGKTVAVPFNCECAFLHTGALTPRGAK